MFSFGFYNSKNNDRMYNASHLGKIFDGVIQPGIFGTIKADGKEPFQVEPTSPDPSLTVKINTGKAWLDHTWNILDTAAEITFADVNANRKRTDVICIQVNASYDSEGFASRTNSLVVVQGETTSYSTDIINPDLSTYQKKNSAGETIIWRYPLAYVTIYGTTKDTGTIVYHAHVIESANIKTAIGTGSSDYKYKTWTPLVTGATMDSSSYIPSMSTLDALFNSFLDSKSSYFNEWFDDLKETVIIDTSAQAALAQLNTKIDNKILYGTGNPPATLEAGQVYFQYED